MTTLFERLVDRKGDNSYNCKQISIAVYHDEQKVMEVEQDRRSGKDYLPFKGRASAYELAVAVATVEWTKILRPLNPADDVVPVSVVEVMFTLDGVCETVQLRFNDYLLNSPYIDIIGTLLGQDITIDEALDMIDNGDIVKYMGGLEQRLFAFLIVTPTLSLEV